MKSETKIFDALLPGLKWFTVSYELYADGTKFMMSAEYDALPVDLAALQTSQKAEQRVIYHQLVKAMDNNAASELEVKEEPKPEVKAAAIQNDFFNMMVDITKANAKINYGIDL